MRHFIALAADVSYVGESGPALRGGSGPLLTQLGNRREEQRTLTNAPAQPNLTPFHCE
jgi:hypothetical protein